MAGKMAVVAGALLMAFTAPAVAQVADSSFYIVRLGTDTVAVERWVTLGADLADSLHVVAVTR